MNLADLTLNALKGFAQEVSTWTNSGVLHSIEGHIAQIENAVAADVHAGETAAKTVLADLYSAFHGQAAAPAPTTVTPLPTATAGSGIVSPPPTVQTVDIPSQAASTEPPATGGLVAPPTSPVIVGEPGPEVTPPAESAA